MKKILIASLIATILFVVPMFSETRDSTETLTRNSSAWVWLFEVPSILPDPSTGEPLYATLNLLALDDNAVQHNIYVTSRIIHSNGTSTLKDHGIVAQGKGKTIEVVPGGYIPGEYTIAITGNCITLGQSSTVSKIVTIY